MGKTVKKKRPLSAEEERSRSNVSASLKLVLDLLDLTTADVCRGAEILVHRGTPLESTSRREFDRWKYGLATIPGFKLVKVCRFLGVSAADVVEFNRGALRRDALKSLRAGKSNGKHAG